MTTVTLSLSSITMDFTKFMHSPSYISPNKVGNHVDIPEIYVVSKVTGK